MTRETEFTRIKRAVDNEKTKKMQAELKTESLNNEKERLFKEASELAGVNFTSSEELGAHVDNLKADIEKDIKEMGDILNEEGVVY